MLTQRYALVSCHVEHALDDGAWALLRDLRERRPGGFVIAALMRPPDADEDFERWLERAHEAARLGPLGHHTHFGGGKRARPRGRDALRSVVREAEWLREHGIEARFFCAGGWYMDAELAAMVADLGYADTSATSFWTSWLPQGVTRLELDHPAWLQLGDGRRLLEIPTTRSLGAFLRALARPRGLTEPIVHVHFHDWELRDPQRRHALVNGLRLLALRRRPARLDRLVDEVAASAAEVPLAAALRNGRPG